jgi:hypothetical protein
MPDVRNAVLVHGGFVDGLVGRIDLLAADGYNVSVVQNQTLSLDTMSKPPATCSTCRTVPPSSWAIPTAAR